MSFLKGLGKALVGVSPLAGMITGKGPFANVSPLMSAMRSPEDDFSGALRDLMLGAKQTKTPTGLPMDGPRQGGLLRGLGSGFGRM